jgi:hypothetical protein
VFSVKLNDFVDSFGGTKTRETLAAQPFLGFLRLSIGASNVNAPTAAS